MIANYVLVENDPYNKSNKRNLRNMDCHECNCGGYALGIMNWYVPLVFFDYSFSSKEEAEEKTDMLVEAMLDEIDDLRVINTISDLHEDEYAVAFRFTSSVYRGDFHFMKRGRNGQWYEKSGPSRYINRVPARQVFSKSWHYETIFGSIDYDSPLVLFAKKSK